MRNAGKIRSVIIVIFMDVSRGLSPGSVNTIGLSSPSDSPRFLEKMPVINPFHGERLRFST